MPQYTDMQQWQLVQGEAKPLTIGTRVRLSPDHYLKPDWPDEYVVVGLRLERRGRLNIAISDSLNGGGGVDGWRVAEFIAV